MSADNDLWYVKTADGDVDRMTLDELDEAFNAGRIDENATVLPAGESTWVRLGELLGGEPAAAAPAPLAAQAPAPLPAAYAAFPPSIRPVSVDLSDDLDAAPFAKKSRKGVVVGAVVATLAIAGIVFAATKAGGSVDSSTATASISVPPPATVAAPPPPPPAPAPVVAPPATPDTRLTDDQRSKLAAADKALKDRAKDKRKNRAGAAVGHSGGKVKTQGFTSGGNKYDPLNANL